MPGKQADIRHRWRTLSISFDRCVFWTSADQRFGEDIILALSEQLSATDEMSDGKSHNFRVDYAFGSAQSDVIFDDLNTLPKEVTLRTILNGFEENYDIFEVNVFQHILVMNECNSWTHF